MERRKTGDGSKLEMTVCRGWGKSSLATSYPCDATSEASGERSQAARARPKPVIAAGAAAALLQSRKPVLACGARSDVAAGGASRCQLSKLVPRSGASMCSVRPSLRLSVLASLAAEEPRTLCESAFQSGMPLRRHHANDREMPSGREGDGRAMSAQIEGAGPVGGSFSTSPKLEVWGTRNRPWANRADAGGRLSTLKHCAQYLNALPPSPHLHQTVLGAQRRTPPLRAWPRLLQCAQHDLLSVGRGEKAVTVPTLNALSAHDAIGISALL